MTVFERDLWARREQCKDLLREAERERLARLALSTAQATRYRKAVCWLGGCLQSWGRRLMELGMAPAYGEPPQVSTELMHPLGNL
jgi:hypothetical protein